MTPGRIARVGGDFVIVEQLAAGDLAHTFGMFRIGGQGGGTDSERFKLCPECCLFMLLDQRPKGRQVRLMQDPAGWWPALATAIDQHASRVAPRPN